MLPVPQAVIYLVIFLVVQLVTQLVIAFAAGNHWLPEQEMTNIATGLAALINSVWMIYVLSGRGIDLWDQSRAAAYSGGERVSRGPRMIAASVVVLALAVAANLTFNGIVAMSGIREIDPLYARVSDSFSQGSYAMQMIVFGLLVPLSEEIAFRGILYRAIRQRLGGTTVPILITAFVFAVYHGNFTQGLYGLLTGALLCVVCEAGGLVAAILLHMGINMTSLVGNTMPAYNDLLGHAAEHWPVFAAAAALTIALTLIVLRLLLYTKERTS